MSTENTQEDHPFQRATSTPLSSSPTRAYFPPSKPSSITPTLSATLTASLATLASKKAYINLPSIQKVIAIHNSSKQDEANAPDYDETIASIPVLDLLPPPPVYDIVNCSTSQTLLLVSSLINTILAVNDRLACPKITLFHSRAIPNISIEAYLSRILQYAPFQNEVLLIILLYFDRIGGGCKPTQVLTNTIPKALLRQASMLPEMDTKPKLEDDHGASHEKSTGPESDPMEEEEPIADEIYTSSSESPVGSKLIINSFNIHRLLITSILVACKFSSDVFYPNVRYARVSLFIYFFILVSHHPSWGGKTKSIHPFLKIAPPNPSILPTIVSVSPKSSCLKNNNNRINRTYLIITYLHASLDTS